MHAAARRKPVLESAVRTYAVDLLDSDRVADLLSEVKPNYILHAAWTTAPGEFWASPQNFDWLKSSVFLAERFYRQGGRRFVGIGSCAEYGTPQNGVCREFQTPIRPTTLYGASKAAMSYALESASLLYGRSSAWARIFFPYGVGEPRSKLFSRLLQDLEARRLPELQHPDRRLDFINIEDVADAVVAIVDSAVEGPVNVGSGKAISIRDVLMLIVRRFYPDLQPLLSSAPPSGSPQSDIFADIARLQSLTGFEPRITLVEGFSQMREHFPHDTNAAFGQGPL